MDPISDFLTLCTFGASTTSKIFSLFSSIEAAFAAVEVALVSNVFSFVTQVSLSISILLSLTVFFLLLAEIIPPTSMSVPLLGNNSKDDFFSGSNSTFL